jgi:hypothetical protein
MSFPCDRCGESGEVLVDISSLGIGPGGIAMLTAGIPPVRGEDGSCRYPIVCPRCDGPRSFDVERATVENYTEQE